MFGCYVIKDHDISILYYQGKINILADIQSQKPSSIGSLELLDVLRKPLARCNEQFHCYQKYMWKNHNNLYHCKLQDYFLSMRVCQTCSKVIKYPQHKVKLKVFLPIDFQSNFKLGSYLLEYRHQMKNRFLSKESNHSLICLQCKKL